MAMTESSPSGQRVVTHGVKGQCLCGKPAETEMQIGWIPKANAGAGGGQYQEICWACKDADYSPSLNRCIMQKYVRKPEVVEAVQFTTNNDPDNTQMNEIVDWIKSHGGAARHDGTDIYIYNRSWRESRVSVGEWVIKHSEKFDCVFYSVPHCTFEQAFDPCEHLWEVVDNSKYDQCLVCGDTRLFEMQYFGDEIL